MTLDLSQLLTEFGIETEHTETSISLVPNNHNVTAYFEKIRSYYDSTSDHEMMFLCEVLRSLEGDD